MVRVKEKGRRIWGGKEGKKTGWEGEENRWWELGEVNKEEEVGGV